MKKITLASVVAVLFLCTADAFAQSAGFEGRWVVSKMNIKGAEKAGITDQNCTWCGHYKTNVPIEVDKEGKVKYMLEGVPQSAKFTLQGSQLKVNFYDSPELPAEGSIEGYTIYEYRTTSNGFVIKRSDPLVSETYEFKKLN